VKQYTNTRGVVPVKCAVKSDTNSSFVTCHVSTLLATLKRLKLLDSVMCVCVHHTSWLHQTASVVQSADSFSNHQS